jgi:hypothetical protein
VRWRLGAARAEGRRAAAPDPVRLCVAETEAEAVMIRGLLEENGITVAVAPTGGPDLRGMYAAGGRCVLIVRPEDADEARALVATHFS